MNSAKTKLTHLALRSVSLLPLRVIHAAGGLIGLLVHLFPNRQSRYINRNLSLCFPSMTEGERTRLVRKNMTETGKNLTELAAFWYWPERKIRELVVEIVNQSVLDEAREAGAGVIIAAPHCGAWELIGVRLTCDDTMHFLYRPNKKSHLNDLILSARERFGGKCHPITARGLSSLVRALKNGEMIGILPDQEPHEQHGVFAPFFSVPAYTMTFLTSLAKRTGAPVIFAVMERLPKAEGYRLHYIRADNRICHENVEIACTVLNKHVEQCVELAPAQYMWNYRRFRKTPDNKNNTY